jgi:hypothetical protein
MNDELTNEIKRLKELNKELYVALDGLFKTLPPADNRLQRIAYFVASVALVNAEKEFNTWNK